MNQKQEKNYPLRGALLGAAVPGVPLVGMTMSRAGSSISDKILSGLHKMKDNIESMQDPDNNLKTTDFTPEKKEELKTWYKERHKFNLNDTKATKNIRLLKKFLLPAVAAGAIAGYAYSKNKQASGLPSMIKNQQEITTQLERQIEGTQGPLANVLITPITGDGKSSRTAGMNSSPQAKRTQKRHSPNTHREIGKKTASLFLTDLEKSFLSASFLPPITYSVSKGIADRKEPLTKKHLGETAGLGALSGLSAAVGHRVLFPERYGPQSRNWVPAVAFPLILGAVLPAFYSLGRSEHVLADKFLYDQKSNG